MKRFFILIVIVFVGCGDAGEPDLDQLIDEVNSSGKITDEQTVILNQAKRLSLNGLTAITDEQAESLSKVERL